MSHVFWYASRSLSKVEVSALFYFILVEDQFVVDVECILVWKCMVGSTLRCFILYYLKTNLFVVACILVPICLLSLVFWYASRSLFRGWPQV